MPASPTTTDVAEVEQTEGTTYCASCPHSQDEHDATALRYCAATLRRSQLSVPSWTIGRPNLANRLTSRNAVIRWMPPAASASS